jgi:hypothetical protein
MDYSPFAAAKKASIFSQGDWGGISQPPEITKLG